MSTTDTPMFSLLLPTRGRVEMLRRLFDSIVEHTHRLDQLEICLCVDDDDLETQAVEDERLIIKKAVIPRGGHMGEMNRAAYDVSTGRYVMVFNDDIILRTEGWDILVGDVLEHLPDEVALIHVNDLLFKEKLCTFPMLSRAACEAIGLCPPMYHRYQIDDHIYDTYNLLAYLGYARIIYMPDVVFEHENHDNHAGDPTFVSENGRSYAADKPTLEEDERLFEASFEDRKEDAVKLARMIDEAKGREVTEYTETRWRQELGQIKELYTYRAPSNRLLARCDFGSMNAARARHALAQPVEQTPRVTIGVVSADISSDFASTCIRRIKEHTTNYDLIVLDNNRGGGFRHAREMNKVLREAVTDYVVLMDDDVYVEDGWVEGMLRYMDDDTGVVVPMHKNRDGEISFSGIYLNGDETGSHEHFIDRITEPRVVQSYCSALLMQDMRKCGRVMMETGYKKYFFDIAHGLAVWEKGFKAICTPDVTVTHLGGATGVRGTGAANHLWIHDQFLFLTDWVKSGRLAKLEQGIWRQHPSICNTTEVAAQINKTFELAEVTRGGKFKENVMSLILHTKDQVGLRDLMVNRLHCVVKNEIDCGKGETDLLKFCFATMTYLKQDRANVPQYNWQA